MEFQIANFNFKLMNYAIITNHWYFIYVIIVSHEKANVRFLETQPKKKACANKLSDPCSICNVISLVNFFFPSENIHLLRIIFNNRISDYCVTKRALGYFFSVHRTLATPLLSPSSLFAKSI